jgi:hypothetical protein
VRLDGLCSHPVTSPPAPCCRDHSVQDGLDYVATWNSAQLPQSGDLQEVFAARAEGRRPRFRPLSRL